MDPELTTQLIDKVVDRLELKTLPTEYGRVAMFEATSECPGMHVHFAIEADGEVLATQIMSTVAFPAVDRSDLLAAANEWHCHHRWPQLAVVGDDDGDQRIVASCHLGIEDGAHVSWIAEQVRLTLNATQHFWKQFSGGPDPTADLIAGLESMLRNQS